MAIMVKMQLAKMPLAKNANNQNDQYATGQDAKFQC